MTKLAVATPGIGVISETFIKRHINNLYLGETCVIAETRKKPHCGQWETQNPSFIIDEQDFSKVTILDRVFSKLRRSFNLSDGSQKAKAIQDFLTKQGVEVFMAEYLDFSLYYLPICKALGIRFFAHAHGYDVSSRLRDPNWRKRYLELNKADGVITMSQYSKLMLEEIGIVCPIYVVPYGIIIEEFPVSNVLDCSVKFLASGRLVSKKAPLVTLKAFNLAQKDFPDMTLTFIGSGSLEGEMKSYITQNKLENKVKMLGALPNEEVLKIMNRSDIYVQHSVVCPDTGDMEGLPVSILEAMASGLPIVSTRHAGIPESVVENENGFLVDEFDAQ